MAELMKNKSIDVNSELFNDYFSINTKVYNFNAIYFLDNESLINDYSNKKVVVVGTKYKDYLLLDNNSSKYAFICNIQSADVIIINNNLDECFIDEFEINSLLSNFKGDIIALKDGILCFKNKTIELIDEDIVINTKMDKMGNVTAIK